MTENENAPYKIAHLPTTEMTDENSEDALDRAPWCILVPTEYPDDPDIIGPFATSKDAHNWSLSYPGGIIRKMASPEFEILHRREREEDEAAMKPRN